MEVNKPLSATIALTNWAAQGDNRTLDCGDFLVDMFHIQAGRGQAP
ncbi:MAG: hypothetical protein ACLTGJ_02515 [Faecalibacterium prausnitzii]